MQLASWYARKCSSLAGLVLCTLAPSLAQPPAGRPQALGKITFEANAGQTDPRVKFIGRRPGCTLFLTATEAVMSLGAGTSVGSRVEAMGPTGHPGPAAVPPAVLRMKLVGANRSPGIAGLEQATGKVNYLTGRDPSKWRTNVPTYARVRYRGVYPGIDLVYYGNQGQLEYDFVVAPGADPRRILLGFAGASKVSTDAAGALVLRVGGQEVRFGKPLTYQDIGGKRRAVAARWDLSARRDRAGFRVAAYDRRRPLVIDPVLIYSTAIGHSVGNAIAVDAAGYAYTAGAGHTDLPVTEGTRPYEGQQEAFVCKLNPAGEFVYSTFLGGSSYDNAFGVAIDGAGCAYVAGLTLSDTFPVTAGGRAYAGSGTCEAFVTKLDAVGTSLVYSTCLPGSCLDWGACGIALDGAGCAYFVGTTDGSGYAHTPGARGFAGGAYDAFVTKLSPDGTDVVYSTCLGGSRSDSGWGIAVDGAGCAYVAGHTESWDFPTTSACQAPTGAGDAFVTKLSATGTGLVYSTCVGGGTDVWGWGIAIDGATCAYVVGSTPPGFPITAGARPHAGATDLFVAKLDPAGSAPLYATCVGGSADDFAFGIAVDERGCAYVTGGTWSADYPISGGCRGPVDVVEEAFVSKLDPTGRTLVFSSCLGGFPYERGKSIAVGSDECSYVTGNIYFIAKLGASTALSALPGRAGAVGQTVSLSTTLIRTGDGAGLADRCIEFSVDATSVGTAMTDAEGHAARLVAIPEGVGDHETAAAFDGDNQYGPSGSVGLLTASTAGASILPLDRSGVIGDRVALKAWLWRSTDWAVLAGRSLAFSVDGTGAGSASTNSTGMASLQYVIPFGAGAGDRVIAVAFAGDASHNATGASAVLHAHATATSVTVIDRSGPIGSAVYLKGYLKRLYDSVMVSGKVLTFSIDGADVGSATTAAMGRAVFAYAVPEGAGAGVRALAGRWDGDAVHGASSGSATLTVQRAPVNIWVLPRTVARSVPVYLRAYIRRWTDYQWLASRELAFTLDGTALGSATTDAAGRASLLWTPPGDLSPGSHTLRAEFAGDGAYEPGSGEGTVVVR